MTKQKRLILDIVKNSMDHMTAEQVFFKAKEEMPGIVMATVYNNLNALDREGEIRRMKIEGQSDRFDKSVLPHEHLVCDCCGKISDVAIENLGEKVEEKLGIKINSYEMTIHYICDDCKKKRA